MITAKRNVYFGDDKRLRIVALGDLHIGCKQFDANLIYVAGQYFNIIISDISLLK